MDYMYKSKTKNFKLEKDFKDFEFIKAWETIWYDWNIELIAEKDSYILFSHNTKNIWEEAFCLGNKINSF
jgi:hypothetical protein